MAERKPANQPNLQAARAVARREAASAAAPACTHEAVLRVLADVGAAFTTARHLEPVLGLLLESAMRVVKGDAGSIMLLRPATQTLEVVAARGARATQILGMRQPVERSVAGVAVREGQAILLHGSANGRPLVSDHPRELASAIVVPLAVTGRVLGVMNVSRERGAERMSMAARDLLDLLAHQASILIDNAQMVDELQRKDERLEQLVDQLLAESGRSQSSSLTAMANPLTPREQEVLDLLVDGLTNPEIAARLCLETDTVKDHVRNIIKRLGAVDRTHAAAIAVRGGLVS